MILFARPACWYNVQTLSEAIEAWNSGKDFQEVNSGAYFSKRDVKTLKQEGFTRIEVPGKGVVASIT